MEKLVTVLVVLFVVVATFAYAEQCAKSVRVNGSYDFFTARNEVSINGDIVQVRNPISTYSNAQINANINVWQNRKSEINALGE